MVQESMIQGSMIQGRIIEERINPAPSPISMAMSVRDTARGGEGMAPFRCHRQQADVPYDCCVHLWRVAQRGRAEPWQSLWHCRACPVGAFNAGRADRIRLDPFADGICPRCRRSVDRLINQRLCISCYNRHREAQRGRNARGSAPRISLRLHQETVAYRDGRRYHVGHFADVSDRLEAIILAVRKAAGAVALCRARPLFAGQQLELPI
ncbi:MAG: hypothetical protein P4M00_24780 [Azospirillaceae bacterium]|nr:hypothetical protein [Azospirillaceae bacterium]